MNERVSALMDGELKDSDVPGHLARLKTDAGLRRAWDTYHLIGDSLRGQIAPGCAARFSERLSAEPTVLAPRPVRVDRSAWFALSAAAGVAGVALVAWLALQTPNPEAQQVAIRGAPAQTAPPVAVAPTAVGVEDYVLAHLRYSNTGVMQGVAPYIRSVSAEQEGGGR